MADEFKDVCFAKVNVDDNSVCSEIQIIFVCVYSVLTFLMSVNIDIFYMFGKSVKLLLFAEGCFAIV